MILTGAAITNKINALMLSETVNQGHTVHFAC